MLPVTVRGCQRLTVRTKTKQLGLLSISGPKHFCWPVIVSSRPPEAHSNQIVFPSSPGGNSFPAKAIGSARATEWEGGGSHPPP